MRIDGACFGVFASVIFLCVLLAKYFIQYMIVVGTILKLLNVGLHFQFYFHHLVGYN